MMGRCFFGSESALIHTYHSLVIDPATVPDGLEITASHDESDEPEAIMGVRHKN